LKRASAQQGRRAIRFVWGLTLLFGVSIVGPSSYPQFPPTNHRGLGQTLPDDDTPFQNETRLDDKRLRQLNLERQKQMVSDSARLLQLARELNEEVTGDSPLTDGQMRKVAEIGKLASRVKERMTFTAGGFPPPPKGPLNPRIQ
jgi:hypothetical protein